MNNPLLEFHVLPPFSKITAEHMVPAIEKVLTDARSGIESLLTLDAPAYETLVYGREELDDRINQVWSPISHMNAVINSPEIREAHKVCLQLLTDYSTEMGQHRGLFEAYQAIAQGARFSDLGQPEQKVVENALRDFWLSGIDLPDQEQAEFSQLARELSELGSTFSNHVLDANQAWSRLVSDETGLPGVPASQLAGMRQAAERLDESGYLLTLDIPCYLAVMTYCEDRALREEVYIAYGTRASDRGPGGGEFDNSETMTALLKARARQAELLGFDNFAALSVARKMARSASDVTDFLEDLGARSRPAATLEMQEIRDFAAELGEPDVQAWDVAFYAEKLKKVKFDISEEELRVYFPAPRVLEGMFEVVRKLFDIDVVPIKDMPVWHEDVMTWEIQREGQPLARFYIDLYTRENKRGGAWMNECRVRRRTASGELQLPVAFLTCNFSQPVGDAPALLTHSEVVTLFHEFGHGLHHMMTSVEAAAVSGINGVAWDAVELPSQFMENFCWQAESLAFISSHYETGEPLPIEMLDKLLSAKNFQSAMMLVRQLEFGLFDFRIHAGFDFEKENQIQVILDEVRKDVAVMTPPPVYAFQHGFSHIFGGGYAAGYYSYKWAEVLSADAFSKFLEDGLFNRQTGEKFLSTILEKGGSEDAMDLFVAFRGREPEIEALLRQDGILA